MLSLFTRNKRKRRPKVFCIGANKTGTTTLESTLKSLGYKMPAQRAFELKIHDWAQRDFRELINMVDEYEAFQDVPFSLPYTFIVMDQAFPGSKFILSERDNAEQWYQSMTSFHAKIWGKEGQVPTRQELKETTYIYKGRPDETNRMIFNPPHDEPYHMETFIKYYEAHNRSAKEYFRFRPEQFLTINVANENDYVRLCNFLNKKPVGQGFPWENKT